MTEERKKALEAARRQIERTQAVLSSQKKAHPLPPGVVIIGKA